MRKQILYRIILFGAMPLLLASCFAAKEYERPEMINEANYRTDNLPQDSITLADVSYKELFTDPLLVDYIDQGLQNNIDIRVALQQIISAEAYLKQGKAAFLPSVEAGAQYTHQELSANSQFGSLFSSLDQYQLTGSLSWEADIWGKIRSNKRAFQASYLQSVAAHQAVKSRLVADIASTYYNLLSLDTQLRITEETVSNRENSLETTSALKDAGSVTEVAVKQTEAQLYTAQALVIDLKMQIKILENTMSILLGTEPTEIPRGNLEGQNITSDLPVGVPVSLLRNRPDVVAAEYAYMNAFELTNAARSNFYPSLTISATGGFQSLDPAELLDTNSLFATLIGGLTQPIFNKRQIKTQYEVSESQQEQARLNYRQAILTATKDVSDALYSYEAATAKIEVKRKEYDAYGLATSYSEELLNNGLANYLEVLTARENALNSALGLVTTRNNQLQAVVDLYVALGGGWQ